MAAADFSSWADSSTVICREEGKEVYPRLSGGSSQLAQERRLLELQNTLSPCPCPRGS